MNYKYNITFLLDDKPKNEEQQRQIIGFKSKKNMINYLNSNKNELNKLTGVQLNFKQISLSLSQSSWRIKKTK